MRPKDVGRANDAGFATMCFWMDGVYRVGNEWRLGLQLIDYTLK